jgi:hypothetical protein
LDWNPVIIVLISVSLGWLLNEISSFITARKNDKKIIRKVLFDMLEIWWILRNSDIKLFMRVLNLTLSEYFKVKESSIEHSFFEMLKPFYEKILEQQKQELLTLRDKPFNEIFYSNIRELSAIDPILSFKLSGKNSVINISKEIDDKLDNYINYISQLENLDKKSFDNSFQKIRDIAKEDVFAEIILDIENNLKRIAKISGLITYLKIYFLIKHYEVKRTRKLEKFFKEIFQKAELV